MTEDDLEQLAITWFQDSGWEYRHSPVIALGRGTITDELA